MDECLYLYMPTTSNGDGCGEFTVTDHFRHKSFHAVDCTGTDNQPVLKLHLSIQIIQVHITVHNVVHNAEEF